MTWLPSLNPHVVPDLTNLDGLLESDGTPRAALRAATRTGAQKPRVAPQSRATPAAVAEEPCRRVEGLVEALRKALIGDDRHAALARYLMLLQRARREQHPGVASVLPGLREEFVSAVLDDRGGEMQAGAEFDRVEASIGLTRPVAYVPGTTPSASATSRTSSAASTTRACSAAVVATPSAG